MFNRRWRDWLTIDDVDIRDHGVYRIFRRADGETERALLVVRAHRDPLLSTPVDGVKLVDFGARAAHGLDPCIGAELFMRAQTQRPVENIVMTWDGELDALPVVGGWGGGEVEDTHALLSACLPREVQARIPPEVDIDRALLRDALDLDTFDALILTRDIVENVAVVRTRPVRDDEIASLVRALFPDEWRAECELREQLAAVDDETYAWLCSRATT